MFAVIDSATGATLSTHKSRAIANRVIDRRNADRAALVSLWRTIGRRHGMKCLSNKGQSAIRFIARTGGRGVLHLAERSEIRRAS